LQFTKERSPVKPFQPPPIKHLSSVFEVHLGSERVTLSIGDISLPSLYDTSLTRELPDVTRIPAITSSLESNTSGNPGDIPTQQTLPSVDDSGANTDFDEFKADLQAQTAPTLSDELGNDLTSLLKDLTSGNTSAAKADVSKVQVDLQTQDASSVAAAPTGKPLDSVIRKISDSLNSGGIQGAPQDDAQHDLADFLVENGRGKGSLINTSA
jgi:hypothetical protein